MTSHTLTLGLRRPTAALAAAAVCALVPAAAHASTVSVSGVTATYNAAAGEDNSLEIAKSAGKVRFTDSGAPVTPGAGCVAQNANAALCDIPVGGSVTV